MFLMRLIYLSLDKSNRNENCITISSSGAYAGFVNFHQTPIFASDCFTLETKSNLLNQKFLFQILKSKQDLIYSFQSGAGQPHVYIRDFDNFTIPLPALEKQNQIIAEIEILQKEIYRQQEKIEKNKNEILNKILNIWNN